MEGEPTKQNLSSESLQRLIRWLRFQPDRPLLVLAPMQDVTEPAFCSLLFEYSRPDLIVTPYFRVYPGARMRKKARPWVTAPWFGKVPVVAQLMGNDPEALCWAAWELLDLGFAGIDLNLGCPAPVVRRKGAGSALLEAPQQIEEILQALRRQVNRAFSVKTRLGVERPDQFLSVLEVLRRSELDWVTIHPRTVLGPASQEVDFSWVQKACSLLSCAVVANGELRSARVAVEVLYSTGAHGVMIGRWAVRNPWIFDQIRKRWQGEPVEPTEGAALLAYWERLWELTHKEGIREAGRLAWFKHFLRFAAAGLDSENQFLQQLLHARTIDQIRQLSQSFLSDRVFSEI